MSCLDDDSVEVSGRFAFSHGIRHESKIRMMLFGRVREIIALHSTREFSNAAVAKPVAAGYRSVDRSPPRATQFFRLLLVALLGAALFSSLSSSLAASVPSIHCQFHSHCKKVPSLSRPKLRKVR